MTCNRFLNQMTDVLTEEIARQDRDACMAHYMSCDQCGPAFEALATTWSQLGSLPEHSPSPHLRTRFYAMLDGYQEGKKRQTSTGKRFGSSLFALPIWGFGLMAACLFIAGFLLGRPSQPVPTLELPVDTGLQTPQWYSAPSATARLQGISTLASQPSLTSENLIPTLLYVLETDPSVDVRLAALRALRPMAQNPLVQQGFRRAVVSQDAPLVQIGILDIICEANSPQTTDTLENLLQKDPLNPFVKQRAQELLLENR